MDPLPRLQARIASLRELRDLTRALRALAATHVQEAQAALEGIRRYVGVVEDAIGEGARLLPPGGREAAAGRRADGSVLIVVCSEHGFVGPFNERLLERAEAERRPRQRLLVVGRRGGALAAERGLEVEHCTPMATHVGGVPTVTRQVSAQLATVSAATVIFGSYRRGGNFEVEARSILPLDPALLRAAESGSPPLHHLDAAALLQQLAGEYLFAEVSHAVMESLASENGARLHVMEAADHNIGDKLDELRRTENSLRQEAITSELLDLVTGSEAILGPAV